MDLLRTSFEPERRVFHELAMANGFALVVAEDLSTSPVRAAWYGIEYVGRPSAVTLRRRVSVGSGGSTRTFIEIETFTAAAVGRIGWTAETIGRRRAARSVEELKLTPDADGMPAACRRAYWQLTQPLAEPEGAWNRAPENQLRVAPRTAIERELPPGLLATAETVVVTAHDMARDPAEARRALGRCLDRAGWMCWSLEHGADVPDGFRV